MTTAERASKPRTENDEFEQRLANADLTKMRFAELTGTRRENVIRWRKQGAPAWTVAWLIMYKRAGARTRKLMAQWADFKPGKQR